MVPKGVLMRGPKAVLNAVKGNQVNAVKASACWVWKPKTKIPSHRVGFRFHQRETDFLPHVQGNPQMDLQDQGVIDSGCSRHMTGNMSYLIDFEEIDGGYVRPLSVARTPQQNGVAERKNRTLIEAARTMLADSKLPTTFWAEAVNTACYVQNRSMNYKPIIAGNQSNSNAGTKACDDAGKARMETVPGKDYILLPLWPADPLLSQSPKSSPDAGFKPSGDNEKKVTKEPGKKGGDPSNKNDSVNSTNNINTAGDGNNTNNVNTVSLTVNTAGIEVNAVSSNTSI
ncbi:putative ribonuclease H-like domain-containing protein [Tanacetum coccineum]